MGDACPIKTHRQNFFAAALALFAFEVGVATSVSAQTVNLAPQNQITFTGFSAANTSWTSDHQITPAPEPATYGMIFIGAALAFFMWRRRNNCATVVSQ